MGPPRLRSMALSLAAVLSLGAGCSAESAVTPVPRPVQSRKAPTGTLPDLPEITKPSACKGYVALTFDDGPTNLTIDLLTVLKFYEIPATFFNLGVAEVDFPRLVQRTQEDGFEIGNHTMTHVDLLTVSSSKARAEIVDESSQHVQLGFKKQRLFRPPYGSTNDKIRGMAESEGLTEVLWTHDSKDFETPDYRKVIKQSQGMKDGGVLLMHDGKPQTLKALPGVLRSYYAKGLCFGQISPTKNEFPTPLGISMKARATQAFIM